MHELAQLNIAVLKEPLESPSMSDFVGNLDRISALAEQSPGFVWRLQSDEVNATDFRPLGEHVLVNLSGASRNSVHGVRAPPPSRSRRHASPDGVTRP